MDCPKQDYERKKNQNTSSLMMDVSEHHKMKNLWAQLYHLAITMITKFSVYNTKLEWKNRKLMTL